MLLESSANFPCSNLLSNGYFLEVSQKSQPNLRLAMLIAKMLIIKKTCMSKDSRRHYPHYSSLSIHKHTFGIFFSFQKHTAGLFYRAVSKMRKSEKRNIDKFDTVSKQKAFKRRLTRWHRRGRPNDTPSRTPHTESYPMIYLTCPHYGGTHTLTD